MSKNIILIDIDHTLADAAYRDPLIGEGGWDAYHEAAAGDQPLEDVAQLVRALQRGTQIQVIGLTARPAKWAQLTQRWCVHHDIPLNMIIMRNDEERRPSAVVKIDSATKFFGDVQTLKDRVLMVIDDRDDVLAPFRALGITTLQVSSVNALA